MNGPSFAEFEAEALPQGNVLEAVDADTLVQSGWRASLRDWAHRICRHCTEHRKPLTPPFELEWAVEGHHHPLDPGTIESGWFSLGRSRCAGQSCPVRHRRGEIDYRTRSVDPNSRT